MRSVRAAERQANKAVSHKVIRVSQALTFGSLEVVNRIC